MTDLAAMHRSAISPSSSRADSAKTSTRSEYSDVNSTAPLSSMIETTRPRSSRRAPGRHTEVTTSDPVDASLARDASDPTLLLEKLGAQAVERRRAVLGQRLDDRLVIGERERRLERPPSIDRVGDLGCRLRVATAVEDLGEQTRDGGSETHTDDPHGRDASARAE